MSEWYVDSIQHTNLKKRVISEYQESLLGVAQIIRLFFKKNITSRNWKLLRILESLTQTGQARDDGDDLSLT